MCWNKLLNKKNTYFYFTNISVVLHNLLQCVWIKALCKKFTYTAEIKTNK